MEDRRKQETEHHLGILWDNVFKYESELRNNKEQKQSEAQKIKKIYSILWCTISTRKPINTKTHGKRTKRKSWIIYMKH